MLVMRRRSRGAAGDAELGEGVLEVPADRVLADEEHRCDLLVSLPSATCQHSRPTRRERTIRALPPRPSPIRSERPADRDRMSPASVNVVRAWKFSEAEPLRARRRPSEQRSAVRRTVRHVRAMPARDRAQVRERRRGSPLSSAVPIACEPSHPAPADDEPAAMSLRVRPRQAGRRQRLPTPARCQRPQPATRVARASCRSPGVRGEWSRPPRLRPAERARAMPAPASADSRGGSPAGMRLRRGQMRQ